MAHAKHNLLLGCRGEELAAQYFENLGAEIMGRNVRYHCGELDVVARFPDGEVVQGKPYMPVRFDVLVVLMNGDDVNYEHYEGVTDGAW